MMKLLLVDDSELIRLRLTRMLRGVPGMGAVHAVGNLTQALRFVREGAPDMVLLDLYLPDGHALHTLAFLKCVAPAMQIVVMTNDASEFNRRSCLRDGADAFFDKTMECEQAMALLRRQAALRAPIVEVFA